VESTLARFGRTPPTRATTSLAASVDPTSIRPKRATLVYLVLASIADRPAAIRTSRSHDHLHRKVVVSFQRHQAALSAIHHLISRRA
jgi:hypothetical protein